MVLKYLFYLALKKKKKDEEKITVTLKKGKSTENLMVGTNTNKKLKVNRVTSPDRNRIKRNKKK